MALVVFTGGARSGKSSLAQDLARSRELDGAKITVVVFGDEGLDSEMACRVKHHRQDRPASFRVVEASSTADWLACVPDDEFLLLDCLGSLVTRALDETLAAAGIDVAARDDGHAVGDQRIVAFSAEIGEAFTRRVDDAVLAILKREADTIVVTNEVGDGVVPAYPSGRAFRDVLGRANRRLVHAADAAYLVVCGRAFDLCDLPASVSWPEDR